MAVSTVAGAVTGPAAGDPPRWTVRVQSEDFDPGAELERLGQADGGVGALASFIGLVRDHEGPLGSPGAVSPGQSGGPTGSVPLQALHLEHYPGMTERSIAAMLGQAGQRFGLRAATVLHRVGRLGVGERIVLVAVAAAHRREAFDACAFLMDWLKTEAPFWKKAIGIDGLGHWVAARAVDDAAARRWGLAGGNASPEPLPPRDLA